jgi:hypothetical protein
MIAESIIGAAQEMTLSVPLVVRLQGTNSAEGLKLVSAPVPADWSRLNGHPPSFTPHLCDRRPLLTRGA